MTGSMLQMSLGLAAGLMLLAIPSMGADTPPADTATATPSTTTPPVTATSSHAGVIGFKVKDIDGTEVPLSRYKNKVLLIVNTASLCGNTPQYASLQTLYEKYRGRGLRILAFPANNFGHQEPGSSTAIKEFCSSKYRVTFDLFSKVSVKGDDQAPLYRFLTDKTTDPKFGGDIEWNFAKFLVGRDGQVVGRFGAGHNPLLPDVITAVETQLAVGEAKG